MVVCDIRPRGVSTGVPGDPGCPGGIQANLQKFPGAAVDGSVARRILVDKNRDKVETQPLSPGLKCVSRCWK